MEESRGAGGEIMFGASGGLICHCLDARCPQVCVFCASFSVIKVGMSMLNTNKNVKRAIVEVFVEKSNGSLGGSFQNYAVEICSSRNTR